MNRLLRLRLPSQLLIGALLFSSGIHAAENLDQKAVHGEYENGNFDSVLGMIAVFEKRNARYPKEDSLFIAKHLSVVYAANPKTAEIGKYWMHRMLTLMPSSDLAGMYVNEDIDRIFDKVRREFLARQAAAGVDVSHLRADSRTGDPEANAETGSRAGHNRKTWIWAGAAGTTVAAAIAIMVLSRESSRKSSGESGPSFIEVEL